MKYISTAIISLLGCHFSLADESSRRLRNLKGDRKQTKAGKAKSCKVSKDLSKPDPVLLQVRMSRLYTLHLNISDMHSNLT